MLQIRYTFILIALFAFSAIGYSQSKMTFDERCATVDMHEWRKAKDPKIASDAEFESWIAEKIADIKMNPNRVPAVITIPTVVHVIHNGDAVGSNENISDAQVLSQITVLNQDFRKMIGTPGYNTNPVGADSEIEFCLAAVDPSGNPTNGINRVDLGTASWSSSTTIDNTVKPATSWDPTQYFNMWVLNLGGGLLGYAQFPSNSGLGGMPANGGAANTDGVVIGYNYFGTRDLDDGTFTLDATYGYGRTATHEVGHCLGLRHIWGDGGCGVDDFCADTPEADGANYGCPNSTSCGSADQVENYMDYSDDQCMNIFTEDQKVRMQAVMMNSPRRMELVNSTVCNITPAAPNTNFAADVVSGCGPLTVNFSDASGANPAITSWSWTFTGGTPATSTMQNPTVTYSAPGTYAVSLTATNAIGSTTETKTGYITVITPGAVVGNALPFTEGFESGSLATNGWTLINPDNADTWDFTTATNGTAPGNTSLWIDHYNYNSPGSKDQIQSPGLDLSGYSTVTLDFEYAYQSYSSTWNNGTDSLNVYVRDECGITLVWAGGEDGSENFSTAGAYNTSAFTPGSTTDWCVGGTPVCPSIDLSAFIGQTNVSIVFETVNDYQNNLYLDNINLYGTVANAPPVANASSTQSVTGCEMLSVTYNDNSSGGPTSWAWTFPGGTPATSTMQNPTVTYSGAGTYSATLTVTNAFGTDTYNYTNAVNISAGPTAFTAAATGIACNGTASGSASANVTGGAAPFTYLWDNGEANATATSLSAGAHTVTVTDAGGCSLTANVTVAGSSVTSAFTPSTTAVDLSLSGTVNFTDGSTGATSWFWDFGDGNSSNMQNPSHTYTAAGTYTVTLTTTDGNGCTSSSTSTITVTTGVATNNIEGLAEIALSPNPSNGNFMLSLETSSSLDLNIEIYNTVGQVLSTEIWSGVSGSATRMIDLTDVASGVYIIRLTDGDKSAVIRAMKY